MDPSSTSGRRVPLLLLVLLLPNHDEEGPPRGHKQNAQTHATHARTHFRNPLQSEWKGIFLLLTNKILLRFRFTNPTQDSCWRLEPRSPAGLLLLLFLCGRVPWGRFAALLLQGNQNKQLDRPFLPQEGEPLFSLRTGEPTTAMTTELTRVVGAGSGGGCGAESNTEFSRSDFGADSRGTRIAAIWPAKEKSACERLISDANSRRGKIHFLFRANLRFCDFACLF